MQNRIHYPESGWQECTRCPLCESRRRTVLRGDGKVDRGTVERDGTIKFWSGEIQQGDEPEQLRFRSPVPLILFLGEAPGEQEDVVGLPFQGEAGRIFTYCLSFCKTSFEFEITDTVACRPTKKNKFGNITNREPTEKEINKCKPRLEQLVQDVYYDGFIHLGKIAQSFKITRKLIGRKLPDILSLRHPSSILKQEYKLHDIKEFALKLDKYVTYLSEEQG